MCSILVSVFTQSTVHPWYRFEHHHSGVGLMTPADVHEGYAEVITEKRTEVSKTTGMRIKVDSSTRES